MWGGIGVYKQVELIALIPDQLKGIADSSTCKVDTPHIKATWRLLSLKVTVLNMLLDPDFVFFWE